MGYKKVDNKTTRPIKLGVYFNQHLIFSVSQGVLFSEVSVL